MADLVKQRRSDLSPPTAPREDDDAAAESGPKLNEIKSSSYLPLPKAPAPAETLVHPKAPAPAETLGDKLKSADQSIQSVVDTANEATSIRHLSFADKNIAHKEPEHEELPEDVAAPEGQPTRKRVVFEKTAGARATRSQKPTIARGMGTSAGFRAPGRALIGLGVSAGFVMSALGMSIASSAFTLGTTNLFDELAIKKSTLRAALAKPGTVDPKNVSDGGVRYGQVGLAEVGGQGAEEPRRQR